jgi:hypothetical protein
MLSVVGVALLLACAGGEGDLVVLKNGKSLQGRVVFQDSAAVVLRQEKRDTRIEKDAVARVQSRAHELDVLLHNASKARLGDVRELELLVSQAEEVGLPGEAAVFWWRMLLLDRDNEVARLALGHKRRGGEWLIPLGARAFDWDKRLALARDWGSAWELASLHYRLRSNLPLEANLDILLDLERLYRAFFELFGAELQLYDVCRPMPVELHADASSYPDSGREFGYYDPSTDVVQVDCSQTLVFQTLAHEATHQLLYDTAFRERNGSGEIPPWVNEGLAEYVAGAVARTPNLLFQPGRPLAGHFRAHTQAKDPFDLTRVLAFASEDYDVSSDRTLKYAQSYTLVHFLLHGAEGAHRAAFFEYLREVYAGKGSSTDLKRCLRRDWRTLEKAWHDHARNTRL